MDNNRKWSFNKTGNELTASTYFLPREWMNAHFAFKGKENIYSLVSQNARGYVFIRDEQGVETGLTNASGDRAVYLMNDEDREVWSISGYPVPKQVQNYKCTYTNTYTRIESEYRGIKASQRIFVPMGHLMEIWTLELENTSGKEVSLNLFPYSSVGLSGFNVIFRYAKDAQKKACYYPELNGIFAENNSPCVPSKTLFKAFMVSSEEVIASTCFPGDLFLPPYSMANPNLELLADGFSRESHNDACLVLKNKVKLANGERKTIHFAVGTAPSLNEAKKALEIIRNDKKVEELVFESEAFYININSKSQIRTGINRLDNLMNHWVKKQMLSYYAYKYAFRDNLQLDIAYSMIDPEKAAENVLDALSFQYEEGYAPHSFRPIIHIQYSDKPAWILMVVPEIIKETGDFSILEVKLPYINQKGEKTGYQETVLEHIVRAIKFLEKDTGEHGLSLMHYADWLDGLDGFSRAGDGGESVMTTQNYAYGLLCMLELAKEIGSKALQEICETAYARVKAALNKYAWDGEWYLRGYSGNGMKVGSSECDEGKIYLNAQGWGILSGAPDEEMTEKLVSSVKNMLETDIGIKVLHPSYTRYQHHIGAVTQHPPGIGMNAIYNHANTFYLVALCKLGRAEDAWRIVENIIPDSENNPLEQSKCEPFSVTNNFKVNPQYYGQAGERWRTNTAAWLYWGLTEFVFGIRRTFEGLSIKPCMPAALEEVFFQRSYRGRTYNITISNKRTGSAEIIVNGKLLESNILPLGNPGDTFDVRVNI